MDKSTSNKLSLDDDAGAWTRGVAKEWAKDLADPRQDLYTSEDGIPSSAIPPPSPVFARPLPNPEESRSATAVRPTP